MENYFFPDELIDLLKKRDYSQFWFHELGNGYRGAYMYLYVNDKADDVETSVCAPDYTISDKTADRMIHVLEHLEECIQRAYDWLSKQDLHDGWLTQPVYSPQELEQILTMWELSFGISYCEPGSPNPVVGSFSLSFDLEDTTPFHGNRYPWHHDVWFHYYDLQPYKSEKDLW